MAESLGLLREDLPGEVILHRRGPPRKAAEEDLRVVTVLKRETDQSQSDDPALQLRVNVRQQITGDFHTGEPL
jgi:hypothetical protein